MKRHSSAGDERRASDVFAAASTVLRERGVPELYWSCGEVGDGVSLIRRADDWAIVIGERGTFDVRASTAQADEAVRMFVEMVVADYEATMAGAEATQDWLRSRGRKRP